MLDLPHVAARVFGTPLLIARGKLDVILSVLAPRLAGGDIVTLSGLEAGDEKQTPATLDGIALVPIVGTLVARSGYLDAASGLLAYGPIGDAIDAAMADPSVRGVLLDIDSPGGEVGGLFDLVARITEIKAAAGKPLWAVANENALSAAYAIASSADRIYVTQTGEVGSIGVVAAHVDESGADAQAGLAWSFIFAGQQKVDGNAHEPLSQRARANIQADVDRLYGEFCNLVVANRGLNIEAVRATQAATYRGALAIDAGLADQLGTFEAAIRDMAAELDKSAAAATFFVPIPHRSPSMSNENREVTATEEAQPVTTAQTLPAAATRTGDTLPVPTSSAAVVEDRTEALRAEYAEVASLATQAARLGVTIDAADAMRKGVSADALRRTILDTLASRAEATTVIAAAPATATAAESPIVRRARERAAAARG